MTRRPGAARPAGPAWHESTEGGETSRHPPDNGIVAKHDPRSPPRRACFREGQGLLAARPGATGLSYGGLTTLLVGFHPTLRDPRIRAAAAFAPAACALGPSFYRAAHPPLLLVQGTQDLLVPIESNAGRVYADARSRRELVELENATHTAFSGLVSIPATTSYDQTLGCPLVVTEFADNWTRLQTLTDPANGIDFAGCTMPCQGPVPTNVPMQAPRQHDLTQATVVAFFESTFRSSRAAGCLLSQGLAAENADVAVERHKRGE
jgi:hypothetical protein